MTGDGFTWEAMKADMRAAERGSEWQRYLIQSALHLADMRGDMIDMGWFTAKYSGDDDGGTLGWGSLADAGRLPGRGKHDANVIKTGKTRLNAEAKHITKAEAKARAAKAAPKGKGGKGGKGKS